MKIKRAILLLATVVLMSGIPSCGIYSFTGTSIQPDVKTFTINYIEYKAMKVNPSLSNDLTEALRERFKKMTRLDEVEEDGDLEFSGQITGYEIRATAITADEYAAQNRLTVNVKIQFENKKAEKDNFDKAFSAYADYSSERSLDEVEAALCAEIIDKLVEDIFNASVAQW